MRRCFVALMALLMLGLHSLIAQGRFGDSFWNRERSQRGGHYLRDVASD
jgi:hypothetical protein